MRYDDTIGWNKIDLDDDPIWISCWTETIRGQSWQLGEHHPVVIFPAVPKGISTNVARFTNYLQETYPVITTGQAV